MNSNKFLPPLVCGFAAAVISTIPGIKTIGCCIVIPAAAWFALILEQRINKAEPPISSKTALVFGLMTGIFAALFSTAFDVLITLIAHSNDFVESLPQTEIAMRNLNLGDIWDQTFSLLKTMAQQIKATGFSLLYTIAILFSNLFIDAIFGIVGGLLGMMIQNKKTSQ